MNWGHGKAITEAMAQNALAYKRATGKPWREIASLYGVSDSGLEDSIRRMQAGKGRHAIERCRERYDFIIAAAKDGVWDRASLAPALGLSPNVLGVWWGRTDLDEKALFESAVQARMQRLPGILRTTIEEDLRAEAKGRKMQRAAALKMIRAEARSAPMQEAA